MNVFLKLFPIILLPFAVGLTLQEFDDATYFGSDAGNRFMDNPEHLDGAFTGGFGEETCRSCHFDYDLNWEDGNLTVNGIPEKIDAGSEYEIKILVEREDLGKAGFQMTARYADGRQAGTFQRSDNNRLAFTKAVPDSLQYIQHSKEGTEPVENGQNSWIINWKAPDTLADSVYFNITANAANNDQSEFGDWIYQQEFVVK